MILAATDLVQVVTSGTQPIGVHASWIDSQGTTISLDRTDTQVSTPTTTTVVGSPALGWTRDVRSMSISNTGGVAETVLVQHTDGSIVSQLVSAPLAAGAVLFLSEDGLWGMNTASGTRAIR